MTSLTDIEFDHDAPFVKQRKLNGAVTYTQDNVLFSSGYTPLKFIEEPDEDDWDDTEDEKPMVAKKKKATSRKKKKVGKQTAAERLKGFKDDEKPDAVKMALKEDAASKAAEELAQ